MFEPEPEKHGNSNTGENLRRVTRESEKSSIILGCSQILVDNLHELLGRIESLEKQNLKEIEILSKSTYILWKQ